MRLGDEQRIEMTTISEDDAYRSTEHARSRGGVHCVRLISIQGWLNSGEDADQVQAAHFVFPQQAMHAPGSLRPVTWISGKDEDDVSIFGEALQGISEIDRRPMGFSLPWSSEWVIWPLTMF